MANASELTRLLSQVSYQQHLNHVEGLDPFRDLLARDSDESVLQFLTRELGRLKGKVRGGVGFVIAERYRMMGNLAALQSLFATDDVEVKESVLNSLRGEAPASNPAMGPGIVALALEAAAHPAPRVRVEACAVIQNQCAWGVDVSGCLESLLSLLGDSSGPVRMQAACAVGNLAKRKYDVSRHLEALRLNLRHADSNARAWSAWALWQLSRSRNDIGPAVADLVRLLASRSEDDHYAGNYAAGALLHHGRRSGENCGQVRRCVKGGKLDESRKLVRRFQEQLAGLK